LGQLQIKFPRPLYHGKARCSRFWIGGAVFEPALVSVTLLLALVLLRLKGSTTAQLRLVLLEQLVDGLVALNIQ